MRQKLSAPISAFLATGIVLFFLSQVKIESNSTIVQDESVLSVLMFNSRVLAAQTSLQLMFGAAVIWIIVFSVGWLLLSLLSRDPIEKNNET